MLDRVISLMPAMTAGRDWTIRQITASACDILGKPPSQLIGRHVDEVLGLDVRSIEAQETDAFDALCDAPLRGVKAALPLRVRGALLADEPDGIYAAFCLIDLSCEQLAAAEIRAL
ncbi:MAG: hypothetical protein ACRED4_08345, partial [Brevundimonas sp.]